MDAVLDRRRLLARGLLGALGLTFTPGIAAAATGDFDAVLSRDGRAHGGLPAYPTLAAALDAAPTRNDHAFRILVPEGEWRERVVVTRPNIHLVGVGRSHSVIVDNASRHDHRRDAGVTATVIVRAPGFAARDLGISNDFDYPHNMPAPIDYDRSGASGAQATALMLDAGSDRAHFRNVALAGYQDTLWADSGQGLFEGCTISGCTDFIYGAGRMLFDRCEIISRLRPGQPFQGFIAAPSTDIHQPYGLIFDRCRLTREPGVPQHSVALGRPWKHQQQFADGKYGAPDAIGQAVFLRCWMDDHIVPEGWYRMHYAAKGGGLAFIEPEQARFFEYATRGPGAGRASPRRRVLNAPQSADFSRPRVLGRWQPAAI